MKTVLIPNGAYIGRLVSIDLEKLRWKQALRVLNALSDHDKDKHFKMGTWLQSTECGTIGCIAGLCSLDPWFQEAGLIAEIVNNECGSVRWPRESPERFFSRGAGVLHAHVRANYNLFDNGLTHADVIKLIERHLTQLELNDENVDWCTSIEVEIE